MAYYEFHSDKSHKFWSYTHIKGTSSATVRWGKVGTKGVSQIIPFDVASRRAAEKIAKGYVRMDDDLGERITYESIDAGFKALKEEDEFDFLAELSKI